ncbi:MAG TPA: extensin family protein [Caulobacter sp.]|nr:extensin family protein [Caulobacter sp.]
MKVALPTLPPASPGQLAWAGLGSALLELSLAAILLAAFVDRAAPPQDLPWKPFSLDHPPGLATGAKLAMITTDPARCRAALLAEDVGFAVAPDRTQGFCSTVDSVRLGDPALSPRGPVMRCDLALTYEVWRRHVVEPAARRTLGSELSRIEHLGTYACRNIYGKADARPSNHATASALDVAGFRLADGRRVSVLTHYRDAGPEGVFLRQVREGGCRLFGATLGPDYNAAHADHLHLDMSPYRLCR